MADPYDAIVVGGGHNGLVAAAYLAQAGHRVLVLERTASVGGAAVSERPFEGLDARLSRYSYLVSLLPDRIITDLGLKIELRSRAVASYTPYDGDGLLVERSPGPATHASFAQLTGSDREFREWQGFYTELAAMARRLAPTMLEPLRSPDEIRDFIGPETWQWFVERPLGEVIEQRFTHDLIRGIVFTDAVIGTFTHAHDPTLRQNRCFLYHLIGNGTGEWRVPVGGMGAVTTALSDAAAKAGATIRTGADVVRLEADGTRAQVTYIASDGGEARVEGRAVLAGVAPTTVDRLLGRTTESKPEGAQVKLNLLLERLPRLKSGIDPREAFAGTFHVREGYGELQRAYETAANGSFPESAPAELYCHTLTDPSILDPSLIERGWHTLTLFGLHTPSHLFDNNNTELREAAVRSYLAALNDCLAEPIEDCLASDASGKPCLEAKTPLDIEAEVGMPGGHIFHGDLDWPWATAQGAGDAGDEPGTWGVETAIPNLLLCGSGARRGGGVSGIGGHNAAHALLTRR